jgi:ABC-type amino acid transport substrate-binding protein
MKMKKLGKILFYVMLTLIWGLWPDAAKPSSKVKKNLMPVSSRRGKEVWVVGTSPDYPPFEFVDDDGNFAGFDMDLFRKSVSVWELKLK